MEPLDRQDFLVTAVDAARRAGEIIMANLGGLSQQDIASKETSDFVTRVDRESEQAIVETISRRFPDHSVLAEESLRDNETVGYRWIIDPLDGTTNFIHAYPVFSVSIALQHGKDVVLGVVYDPARDELFTVERQRGALLNGTAVKVSETADPREGLVTTGFPFRRREMIDRYLILFRNVFLQVSDLRRAGSAALDLAYLACGRCDGFFEIGLSPWDIAAGSLLIEEAGGIVTDFGGGRQYLSTGNIVASNRSLHPILLSEVRSVFRGILDE
jgi:myo-inositol-1(or 4)-monophosphatase